MNQKFNDKKGIGLVVLIIIIVVIILMVIGIISSLKNNKNNTKSETIQKIDNMNENNSSKIVEVDDARLLPEDKKIIENIKIGFVYASDYIKNNPGTEDFLREDKKWSDATKLITISIKKAIGDDKAQVIVGDKSAKVLTHGKIYIVKPNLEVH